MAVPGATLSQLCKAQVPWLYVTFLDSQPTYLALSPTVLYYVLCVRHIKLHTI